MKCGCRRVPPSPFGLWRDKEVKPCGFVRHFLPKNGGEREIRTPGCLRIGGFQDRCLKPLDHLSGEMLQGCNMTAKRRKSSDPAQKSLGNRISGRRVPDKTRDWPFDVSRKTNIRKFSAVAAPAAATNFRTSSFSRSIRNPLPPLLSGTSQGCPTPEIGKNAEKYEKETCNLPSCMYGKGSAIDGRNPYPGRIKWRSP